MNRQILPLPGFTPTIGRLVAMLSYSRAFLLRVVKDLSVTELDYVHGPGINSIGALLSHMVALERWYQILTFEERVPSTDDKRLMLTPLRLGEAGRCELRDRPLDRYLAELASARQATLAALASRDDDWLERPLTACPDMNAHWALFHVVEDEIHHRGQICWLRARFRQRVDAPGSC